MELITPNYYHQFRCIAAACPDSCCQEWAVDVDAEAAARYRALPGELGDRLRQVLRDTPDGTVMEIENRRCPMWQTDGLCRIQAALGHDALCRVCREFPRLRHDYGSVVELGLELSCPEAARLILTAEQDQVLCATIPGGEDAEDPQALEVLLRTREQALALLENTSYPLPQVLAMVLLHGHNAQAELDGAEATAPDPEKLLADGMKYAQSGSIREVFDFLKTLEILTPQWEADLSDPKATPHWTVEIRRFARYLIRRYWLQAVADYDLICRIKFILIACMSVAHLKADVFTAAQRFSKEIENDPDNVEALLDAAYTQAAFTDVRLLGLLLK